MSDVTEPKSKKPGLWDTSVLSPQWTAATVLVVIVLFGVMVKIMLSA